jgi:alkylation response protein AidB-like acyl-CoA dehydrogenase
MSHAPTLSADEKRAMRDAVRAFMDTHASEQEVRRLADTDGGYERSTWLRASNELGLAGLCVPERFDGSGLPLEALDLVQRAAGRALSSLPILSCAVLATRVLLACEDEKAQAEWLPRLGSGRSTATVAFLEPGYDWERHRSSVTATVHGDSVRLSGTKTPVLDGGTADLLIISAVDHSAADHSAAGSLYLVEADAAGLRRSPLATMDITRKQCLVELTDVPARRLGHGGNAEAVLTEAVDHARIALACEQLGGAEFCVDLTVDYVRQRHQFGRPIGSFQAIKHRCADLLVELERARSAVHYAVTQVDDGGDLTEAAALAAACCSEVFSKVVGETIQLHGGIGVTWEHPAHLYFRRAHSDAALLGSAASQRGRLMRSALGS